MLGGSFNPAHAGHLHISRVALHALALDEVWWLVAPLNPLKSASSMAPLDARVAAARALARDWRIRVGAIEASLGTRYTADTLAALRRRFPRTRFVWLMGADNLAQLPQWRRWTRIFMEVPVAALDRAPYSYMALAGKAATRLAAHRLPARRATRLADQAPPAWIFLRLRRHPASATAIRAQARGAARKGEGADRPG